MKTACSMNWGEGRVMDSTRTLFSSCNSCSAASNSGLEASEGNLFDSEVLAGMFASTSSKFISSSASTSLKPCSCFQVMRCVFRTMEVRV